MGQSQQLQASPKIVSLVYLRLVPFHSGAKARCDNFLFAKMALIWAAA